MRTSPSRDPARRILALDTWGNATATVTAGRRYRGLLPLPRAEQGGRGSLDGLLVLLVLLVEDLDAALLGSGTPGQAAGQDSCGPPPTPPPLPPASRAQYHLPPVGGVVSRDVSGAVAARCGTPVGQRRAGEGVAWALWGHLHSPQLLRGGGHHPAQVFLSQLAARQPGGGRQSAGHVTTAAGTSPPTKMRLSRLDLAPPPHALTEEG